jgi:hypothetical protein
MVGRAYRAGRRRRAGNGVPSPTRGGMMRMALENAAAVLDGKPPIHPVNRLVQ